jgi:hypothetical protein
MIKSILEEHLWPKDIFQDKKFQCGFDELVEGVTIELNAMQDTERLLYKRREEDEMYNEEHRLSMQELEKERDKAIEFCKHHSTTYDSGGAEINNPTNTCNTCGKEVSCGR